MTMVPTPQNSYPSENGAMALAKATKYDFSSLIDKIRIYCISNGNRWQAIPASAILRRHKYHLNMLIDTKYLKIVYPYWVSWFGIMYLPTDKFMELLDEKN